MSLLYSRLCSISRCIASPLIQSNPASSVHTMTQWPSSLVGAAGGAWSTIAIRTNIRNHFPRPKEAKRAIHNYEKRMSTHGGRKIIMRRILKGKHVLAN